MKPSLSAPPLARVAEAAGSLADASEFARSVAGVLGRLPENRAAWVPGVRSVDPCPQLAASLDDLGWGSLAQDAELAPFAGLAAVELGRALASPHHVDRLLGGSPLAGELVRSLGEPASVLALEHGRALHRPVLAAEPRPSADGLDVHRVTALGDPVAIDPHVWAAMGRVWLSASVGYLAGLGAGALELTVDYVRRRRAFGATLGALAPVQQLIAGAATAVRGVQLLAGAAPDADALLHAGRAIFGACAACHQVSGAIAYTTEYPLMRYGQRARALSVWNGALLDAHPGLG